ncbi:MAG: polyphenol oxidase [Novosphingobium sp. 28-62-57]|uniref:peptidoglycan editing factor PgeF n=1 Tax=unclassified Novosphingobium TaxID=2644732 RepID=UPI000BD5D203|nr:MULTISPECIES: peptidoglycan editing factor PgeF [unclassified Novosphingobium]OYW50436.1 MAG: polyphenol oxidase [Novosphingobium sp. 12-62-10]OYZ11461.1 MAG: polyphenol oxidase [Novosphingobium sp. 28-62-57]OZA37425.1 MAG: polyphenol oxidase [Novosphingobium sp. 17-62-9]HQS70319.1 peptidoglycan editing factor PgeF [Novosphingobium sp.]
MSGAVEALTHPLLAGAAHGFLGRKGGVSAGDLAGLNVSYSEDDPVLTAENRRRAVEAVLPGGTLQTCYQIHSPDVVTVTEPWADADRPRADALVTNRPGLVLGVLTADCAPVLFCDASAGVIGAAHAGWKGAFTGVTHATITAMEALGATRANIAAVVGPCIAQKSYEVDTGFEARFLEQAAENERFFRAGREGHAWFDLEGYVASRLRDAGLTQVGLLGEDTYAQEARFYSFRRATHRAEASYGRQISLIGLKA